MRRYQLSIIILLFIALLGVATFSVVAATRSDNEAVNINATIVASAACGNDVQEVGEDCDGTDLDGKSCIDFGFDGGTLQCSSCSFDTTSCQYSTPNQNIVCGNGRVEGAEQCDLGSANGVCPALCSLTCQVNSNCPAPTLEVENINVSTNCNTATVSWNTEYHTDNNGAIATTTADTSINQVGYGVFTDEENTVNALAGTSHSVALSDLLLGVNYKYKIYSSDGSKNKTVSDLSFTLSCQVPNPAIAAIPINGGARIDIDYQSYDDVARVIVRRAENNPPLTSTAGIEVYTGSETASVSDSVIDRNKDYWYSVFVCNSYNICSTGVSATVSRLVSDVGGATITPEQTTINLSWSNPASDSSHDFSFLAARVIKTSSACSAASYNGGTLLSEGDITGFTDNNLTPGQTYYYKIFVKNNLGEYSNGVCVSATTLSASGVSCIDQIKLSPGDSAVTVNWHNPTSNSDFTFEKVVWRRDNSCVLLPEEGSSSYSGSGTFFNDSGLTNGQSYTYKSFVYYNQGNYIGCGCVIGTPTGELPEQPTGEVPGPELSFDFLANNGALPIASINQELSWLSGREMTINTSRRDLPKPIASIRATLQGNNYLLNLNDQQNAYQTTLTTPVELGDYSLDLLVIYQDQSVARQHWLVKVLPYGKVYFGWAETKVIAGAEIKVSTPAGLLVGFNISNPSYSNGNGLYGLMVPNGDYILNVSQGEYLPYQTVVKVTNNIINYSVRLDKEQEIIETIQEIFTNPDVVSKTVAKAVRVALDNPQVEQVSSQYVAPSAAVVVSLSTVTAFPWWNLIYYLQSLFTEPLAWLFRRKRKGWGIVYDSLTKAPVDLAVVRLYRKNSDQVIQSRVTDRQGRYAFLVENGTYVIKVTKPTFSFPSVILAQASEDSSYTDLYHGQEIIVNGEGQGIIVANIPIDPEESHQTDKQILRHYFWQGVRKNIAIIGPIISLITLLIAPNFITAALFVFHIILFSLFKRLAQSKAPKGWGVVYRQDSKKSLSKAVVRIFSPEYNRMLDVQVTDKHGRYGFLAGKNVYYLTADKEGFESYRTEDINLTDRSEGEAINRDLLLKPKDNSQLNGREDDKRPLVLEPELSPMEEKAKEITNELKDQENFGSNENHDDVSEISNDDSNPEQMMNNNEPGVVGNENDNVDKSTNNNLAENEDFSSDDKLQGPTEGIYG